MGSLLYTEGMLIEKNADNLNFCFNHFPVLPSHCQLFRKDLISAMKLADSEPLQEGSYFLISDPWRQEWEKGVQVPVNNTQIMQAEVK